MPIITDNDRIQSNHKLINFLFIIYIVHHVVDVLVHMYRKSVVKLFQVPISPKV